LIGVAVLQANESSYRIFDRALLAGRRNDLSESIASADFLHRHVAEDLVERLLLIKRTFPLALDLGAGHGVLGRRLREAGFGTSLLISADASARLLSQAGCPAVVADEEFLPFRDGSLDLVVSGLALQLVNDLPGALLQIRRALKPDGLMLASLLGGSTLHELRDALITAEIETTGGASPRVAPFADVRELGALLQRAGFSLPVADTETLEVGYASPLHLMRDLKAMGWANMLVDRRRSTLRRQTLSRALELYVERYSRPDGRITATFEIVTLTGWTPHQSQQQPLRPGSASIRLADALGTTETSTGEKPNGG
jgi:SAM-dependent methyltransferase